MMIEVRGRSEAKRVGLPCDLDQSSSAGPPMALPRLGMCPSGTCTPCGDIASPREGRCTARGWSRKMAPAGAAHTSSDEVCAAQSAQAVRQRVRAVRRPSCSAASTRRSQHRGATADGFLERNAAARSACCDAVAQRMRRCMTCPPMSLDDGIGHACMQQEATSN